MDEQTQSSYLGLSDEDFANASLEEQTQVDKPVQEDVSTEVDEPVEETTTDISEDNSNVVDNTEENVTTSQEEVKEVVESNDKVLDTIDYKAEYERLVAPFKANGRDITVGSVDDAIALMQMGANYSKKMAGLKPHLRIVKMLEKQGLLDEQKLSYLIDLQSNNPQAITKLVKDSGLDPLEMDTEKASDYKPKSYGVDEREIELDMVLEEIKESPTYQRTLSIVSTDWDDASKQTIATTPQLLKIINEHVSNGVYDMISRTIENERLFGRLQGMSDIEAYRKVGDAIQAQGGFDFLAKKQQTSPKQMALTKPPQVQDDRLKDKKRAAAPTKAASTNQVAKEFNPLALSDEDFSKLAKTQFM